MWTWMCLVLDGLGFLLDAPYVAAPHHGLNALLLKSRRSSSWARRSLHGSRRSRLGAWLFIVWWAWTSSIIKSYLGEHGINHHLIFPYTHEQNGSIEWKHHHITEVGLTLLAHASLPIKYWGEAFTNIVTIINIALSPIIKFDNPYHLLFKQHPNYSF